MASLFFHFSIYLTAAFLLLSVHSCGSSNKEQKEGPGVICDTGLSGSEEVQNFALSPDLKTLCRLDTLSETEFVLTFTDRNSEVFRVDTLGCAERYDYVRAVSDDMRSVILGRRIGDFFTLYRDGVEVQLALPVGYVHPKPQALSSDGSVIVGYASDKFGFFQPVRWTGGGETYELLDVPEQYAGGAEELPGVMPKGCSSDGRVVYGSEWKWNGLIYWKDGVMHNPGAEFAQIDTTRYSVGLSRIVSFDESLAVSPKGKYLVGGFVRNSSVSLVLIDLQQDRIGFCPDSPVKEGIYTVSDDGTVLHLYRNDRNVFVEETVHP